MNNTNNTNNKDKDRDKDKDASNSKLRNIFGNDVFVISFRGDGEYRLCELSVSPAGLEAQELFEFMATPEQANRLSTPIDPTNLTMWPH
jgi:hypothetical protein